MKHASTKLGRGIRLTLVTLIICVFAVSVNAAEPTVDFNADGKADLFLQNVFTGQLDAWLVNGTTILKYLRIGTRAPNSGFVLMGMKDLNSDGRNDLLWYNPTTGAVDAWLLNGSGVQTKITYGTVPIEVGWAPIAEADLNGDGCADLLLRNLYSGAISGWLLNGNSLIKSVSYGTIIPPSANSPNELWAPIAVVDLNGDGCNDLLWRNAYDGYIVGWLLNGNGRSKIVDYGAMAPNSGWSPLAMGDLNGDGCADLLCRNVFTGDISGLLLDGNGIKTVVLYGRVPPPTADSSIIWTPMALKDVNGDGCDDLLWYEVNSGAVAAWFLNGVGLIGSVSYGSLSPQSGWIAVALDDFNGDGKADIFWQNRYTDQTYTWLLNNTGVLQKISYSNLPKSSVWQVLGPR